MARIVTVTGRQILDSQGKPTVEATVQLDDGAAASSSAPSGSVPTKDEAVELRDHISSEYFGTGVSKAVANINTEIRQKLIGMDPLYQTQVDQALVNLDGTTNKSRLGANAILAVSQAVMKAAAASLRLPLFVYVKEKYQLIQAYRLPTPIFNLINGGRHGSGTLDFQEFQLVPASHLSFPQSLRIGVEMFMAIDRTLEQKGAIRAMGVEGGFSPNLAANADALEIFAEAIRLTPYTLAQDAFLGLDVGPRWFYKSGKYTVKDRPQPMTGKELVKYFEELHQQFRVFAFEDPLLPDAWPDWKFMTAEIGKTAMIIADDLIATNKTLLMKAIQEQACNAVVIKPNRVGTITEAIEIISLAKQAGWHTIMSHRSGETTDDILADIAVGVGTDYVKFGAPARGERVVKYNRLSRIAEILEQAQTKAAPAPGTAPTSIDQLADTTTNPDNPQFRNNTNTPDPNVTPVSFAMAAPGAAIAAVTNREQSAAEFMKQTPAPIPSADVLPTPTPVTAQSTNAAPTMASRLAAMSAPAGPAPTATISPAVAPTPTTPAALVTPPTVTPETDDLQENLDALVQQLVPTPVPAPMAPAPNPEPAPAPTPAPVSAPISVPVSAPELMVPTSMPPSPTAPALTLGPAPGTPLPTPTATFAAAPTTESLASLPSQPTVNLPPSVRLGTSPTVNPSPAFTTAPSAEAPAAAPAPNLAATPAALSFTPAPTVAATPSAATAPTITTAPMAAPSTAPSATTPGTTTISSFTPVYPGYSPDNGSSLQPPTPPPTV